MEVVQQQQGRATLVGQGGQGPQGGQRIASAGVLGGRGRLARQAQAAGDVPDGELPVLLLGMLEDLALGLVGLVGLDPEPVKAALT